MTSNLSQGASSPDLRQSATLQEWRFLSSLPLFGRVVAWMRAKIYGATAKWALRSVIQQQSNFNHRILDRIGELEQGFNMTIESSLSKLDWEARILNLEWQTIESDRMILQTRRDLAQIEIAIQALQGQIEATAEVADSTATLRGQVEVLSTDLQKQLDLLSIRSGDVSVSQANLQNLERKVDLLTALSDDLVSGIRRSRVDLIATQSEDNGASSSKAIDGCAGRNWYNHLTDPASDRSLRAYRYGRSGHKPPDFSAYLPYFSSGGEVLDLECGRGELVSFLAQAGIEAKGITANRDLAMFCRQRGLSVECDDLVSYLDRLEDNSVGGIFLGGIVEDLETTALANIFQRAYLKLRDGAYFISEAINPTSLAALTSQYLLDPSHLRPVHPEALVLLAKFAGFQDVSVVFREPTPETARLQPLPIKGQLGQPADEWPIVLNSNFKVLNDFLFGFQNYAVIANKTAGTTYLTSNPDSAELPASR